jgi:hypothetical protein
MASRLSAERNGKAAMSDHPEYMPNRLRALYQKWNNPPSADLPDGAELLLDAAEEIDTLVKTLGETSRREGAAGARIKTLEETIAKIAN